MTSCFRHSESSLAIRTISTPSGLKALKAPMSNALSAELVTTPGQGCSEVRHNRINANRTQNRFRLNLFNLDGNFFHFISEINSLNRAISSQINSNNHGNDGFVCSESLFYEISSRFWSPGRSCFDFWWKNCFCPVKIGFLVAKQELSKWNYVRILRFNHLGLNWHKNGDQIMLIRLKNDSTDMKHCFMSVRSCERSST